MICYKLLPVMLLSCVCSRVFAQADMLLSNADVQIEATEAVNKMYNFKFDEAERDFLLFKQKYSEHPLPYFLLGMNRYWQIRPEDHITTHDKSFFAYMDTAIAKAEKMYKQDKSNPEANFFLAAAYAFAGRVHSDRGNWGKAVWAGKNSVSHLRNNEGNNDLSPEFLFGEGLYNYYEEWLRENYKLLRPVLALFKNGDKKLGLQQLKTVSENAFYTRTEALNFLMEIYETEEDNLKEALKTAQYLHEEFPDNAYFQRYFARLSYLASHWKNTELLSRNILQKIDSGYPGYGPESGRYASFYLGHIYRTGYGDKEKATEMFKRSIDFSRQNGSTDKGYYLFANLYLAQYALENGDKAEARAYYSTIEATKQKYHPAYKEAKSWLKAN